MKSKNKIEWFLGFVAGILAPLFGMVLFFELKPEYTLYENFDPVAFKSLIFQIATLGLLLNMGLFFLALKFNKELISKGLMHATILFLLGVVVYKFIL